MKTIPSKTTHYSHCLPPEAYIRLWNASVETQQTPRFQSTYTPTEKMRTHILHKHPPLFRIKNTHLSGESIKRELVEALEAVLDCYGDSDTLLMAQCKAALASARRRNGQ
jgi:hypothetical protein